MGKKLLNSGKTQRSKMFVNSLCTYATRTQGKIFLHSLTICQHMYQIKQGVLQNRITSHLYLFPNIRHNSIQLSLFGKVFGVECHKYLQNLIGRSKNRYEQHFADLLKASLSCLDGWRNLDIFSPSYYVNDYKPSRNWKLVSSWKPTRSVSV